MPTGRTGAEDALLHTAARGRAPAPALLHSPSDRVPKLRQRRHSTDHHGRERESGGTRSPQPLEPAPVHCGMGDGDRFGGGDKGDVDPGRLLLWDLASGLGCRGAAGSGSHSGATASDLHRRPDSDSHVTATHRRGSGRHGLPCPRPPPSAGGLRARRGGPVEHEMGDVGAEGDVGVVIQPCVLPGVDAAETGFGGGRLEAVEVSRDSRQGVR
jgi:hypothetical protein